MGHFREIPEWNESNILKLADAMVDQMDLEQLQEIAMEQTVARLEDDEDLFEEKWDTLFGNNEVFSSDNAQALDDLRRKEADRRFESYQFSSPVLESNGWTWKGDHLYREVFLQHDHGDSLPVIFHVVFLSNSDQVSSCYHTFRTDLDMVL